MIQFKPELNQKVNFIKNIMAYVIYNEEKQISYELYNKFYEYKTHP